MSKFIISILLFISILFIGCSPTSKLTKQTDLAKLAIANGDFETAYNLYTNYINEQQAKNKEVGGEIYNYAAKAALALKKYTDGEKYFKLAKFKGLADADLYYSMIKVYKMIDNLSKEMDATEHFVKNFKQDARHNELKKRLFNIYVESENWEKALAMWPEFTEEEQIDEKLLELYFTVNKKLKNNEEADIIATNLLKKNVTNKDALEWKAEKHFWIAENKYQAEMEAYEKNKTNKQYNLLVNALDVVTADFKKSLVYFEMLYKLYPSKEYAKYMSNIYIRFQDEKKSEYYRKLSL